MAVITFSRVFPSYHPKKGQPTFFVEKIIKGLDQVKYIELPKNILPIFDEDFYNNFAIPKHHTIRSGKRWKAGDKFSPRVWGNDINPKSGRSGPYHSQQLQFTPDIEIKKVWDFEMDLNGIYSIDGKYIDYDTEYGVEFELAKNDGFSNIEDLFNWLMPNYDKPVEFSGQIICWNENINY